MNKYIKARSTESSVKNFVRTASISGAFWRASEIVSFSNLKLERPVIDIGCGDGRFIDIVFNDKMDYGLDISGLAIKLAKKKNAYRKYIVSRASDIPLPAASVKTAFSNSVFEHIVDLEEVLAEISRILKPCGKLIFTTHSPASRNYFGAKILTRLGFKKLSSRYERFFSRMHQLNTLWSLKAWEKKLKAVGLEITDTKQIISPSSAFWYEFFLPISFVQSRIPVLKKTPLAWILFSLIAPDYQKTHKQGRNFYIEAKKNLKYPLF